MTIIQMAFIFFSSSYKFLFLNAFEFLSINSSIFMFGISNLMTAKIERIGKQTARNASKIL